jgi:hypothetical protein
LRQLPEIGLAANFSQMPRMAPLLGRFMKGIDNLEEETDVLLSSFPVFSWNILSPLIEYPKKSKVGNMMSVYVANACLLRIL